MAPYTSWSKSNRLTSMKAAQGAFHKTSVYSQYYKRHCKLRRSLPLLRHIICGRKRYSCYLNRHLLSEPDGSSLITMNDTFNKIRLSKQDIRQFNISVLKRGTDIQKNWFFILLRQFFYHCAPSFSAVQIIRMVPLFPAQFPLRAAHLADNILVYKLFRRKRSKILH